MRKTWAIALKELRQTLRDPLSLLMLLGLPAFMLLLYGYAMNFDVKHARLAVQDLDVSRQSRDLVAAFVNTAAFDLSASLPAGADPGGIVERGEARAVLVIPEDYSRLLSAGRTARVQFLVDGTDANTAATILGYASSLVAESNVAILAGRLAASGRPSAPPISHAPRVWYNPELLSTHFLVPGLVGFILMLTAVLSTALSVAREKERGTMEQLRVAPLRTVHLIAGKCLPYLGISLLATVFILAAARGLFGVAVRGPYPALLAATLLYLAGALGFGLLISSVSTSQAMAFQVGVIASMLPAVILSGFVFPIRSMPTALRWITYAVPARYYLIVLRGVVLKGAGLGSYVREMAFLGAYAAAVFGIASFRLGKRGE